MSKPEISVLMTAYNAQSYIALSISGILNQTFNDFEFIIIDDNSTDKTWQIISEFQKKDSRIKIFKNETNQGITKNRNKLISLAVGKYIVWQDADDISFSTRLEKQYDFMQSHPEVGLCGSWLKFFNDNKGVISIRKYAATDNLLRKNIFKYSPVAQPAAIIRREVFKQVGKYNEKFSVAEDLEMSFRIGKKYKFANIQEVLVRYREQSKSITFKKLKELELNTLKIRLSFKKDSDYKFKFSDALYNLFQFLSIYIIPANLKVRIFNLIRNSR